MACAKFMISMDNDLMLKIQNYGKKRGLSRSATVSLMCSEYIRQIEMEETMKVIAPLLKANPDLDVKDLNLSDLVKN